MNPPPLPERVTPRRRLSAEYTFFTKRVFPAMWFGFVGIAFLGGVVTVVGERTGYGFLVFPLVMAGIGFCLMKALVWCLVDEVWDEGDSLVVRNGKQEARIDLGNIVHVSRSTFTNPERVTLTLREPCVFGGRIKFLPPYRFFRWGDPPVVTELMRRIDARRQSAGRGEGGSASYGTE